MTILPQCITCKHLDRQVRGVIRCPAFPQEVPDAIAFNEVAHDRPMLGQHGEIVHEPVDPDEMPYLDVPDTPEP